MTHVLYSMAREEIMKNEKDKLTIKQSETWEQKQLIQWCRTDKRLQFLFHIPNESVGGQGWLIRNRQMGVKAGVPDLFYPVPLHGHHGMFIEMKAEKGRLRKEQAAWIKALEGFGYKCVVAHGWKEAKEALEEYLSDRTDL